MKYSHFDNIKRQMNILLLGQELTPIQAAELKDMITVRTRPASYLESTGTEAIQKRVNQLESAAVDEIAGPDSHLIHPEAIKAYREWKDGAHE